VKIKKFNQLFEAFDDSHFIISDEDIQDICMEMTDLGYKLTIDKKYINRGKDRSITKEPLTENASPIYEVELYKQSSEENESKPTEYWNGGLYFQEHNTINIFDSIVNRFKKMFKDLKVLWHIRGDEFRIRIILNEVKTKTGFDAYEFSQRVNDWTESFASPLKCTENFGNSSSKTIEFRRYYPKEELKELLSNTTETKLNNKSDFDEVLRSFDRTFGKEVKNVKYKSISSLPDKPVEWSYYFDLVEKIDWQPERKGIFSKKPEKKEFSWYALNIKYEVVDR
jgi:hypothetical protein